MNKAFVRYHRHLAIATVLTFTYATSWSQSVLYNYPGKSMVRLELNKPFFDDSEDVGFFTLSNYLGVQIRLNDRVVFVADVPFAFSSFEDESDAAIGNIGLGLQIRNKSNGILTEMGIGVPKASDNTSAFFGLLTSYAERITYLEDYLPLHGHINVFKSPDKGFLFRLRTGLTSVIAIDEDLESELFFDLGVVAGYALASAKLQGGFVTTTIITEEDLDFAERLIEQVVLSGEFGNGNLRPGLIIKIPLDEDLSDIYNFSVGISLAYILGE